ncbi:hypothetical protein AX15_003537 [Amanita polypyramis BW_CC]|nr:hypothetical protein AX15_003537 [Amanita polypyramis BW_CC]
MSPYPDKLPEQTQDLNESPRPRFWLWLTRAGVVFSLTWIFFTCDGSRWSWVSSRPLPHVGAFDLSVTINDDLPRIPKEFPFKIPVPLELQRNWGAYTPWFSVADYRPAPEYCDITQVNILQRHGARYPTKGAHRGIVTALNKLTSSRPYTHPLLLFLKDYEYDLGVDELVHFGVEQAKFTGKETFNRYQHLVSKDNIPFVRAASKQRVVDSATNWTVGFAEASNHLYEPKLDVILDESKNCTLDNNQCPNAGDSDFAVDEWISRYAYPIAQRLNAIAPTANLTPADIYGLMDICPFESVAKITYSPFCSLFSLEEFKYFEYAFDLDKYYGTGYGQPLGRVQGVGWVNELLARLTGREVEDHTQTNRTLDGDPKTFPLDRKIYADFSHDNEMIAIYAAIGLFPQYTALDPSHLDTNPNRTWVASKLVPFGARMVVEKLGCDVEGVEGKKEFVRIFVNDAIQPLEFCGGDYVDRMCELREFVKSQSYARHDGEGDWEACFDSVPQVPS